MEWLHFFTKPSFLSAVDLVPSLSILLKAPLPVAFLCIGLLLPLFGLNLLFPWEWTTRLALALGRIVPAGVLTLLAFVTIDVFTKTVVGFGIADAQRPWAFAYTVLLAGLFTSIFAYLSGLEEKRWLQSGWNVISKTVIGVVGLSLLLGILSDAGLEGAGASVGQLGHSSPSVILISGDGIEADHMSVYGYQRDTTPFLREIADQTLLCENAFTNAGPTGASLASLLSGKLPTETRLIYPPDILRGRHSFQHLPMLLGNAGYRSIHLSIRHFADAYDLNMRESFDSSNFRSVERAQAPQSLIRWIGIDSAYLLEHVEDRIESRLSHVFGYEEIEDTFSAVQEEKSKYTRDEVLLKNLFEFIDKSPDPFFAHVHLLGTHGPQFRPKHQVYSKGQEQTEKWMTDFYDDAILDFDSHMRRLFEHLSDVGKLEQTLIVIHTDHAQNHRIAPRIPLILRFPKGQWAGRIKENVQLLDISPTVLDFLEMDQPGWMGGRSLIAGPLDPMEPILAVRRVPGKVVEVNNHIQLDTSEITPPFFTLRYLAATVCDSMFTIDLKWKTMEVIEIPDHTQPCGPPPAGAKEQMANYLIAHLAEQGFDTASLMDFAP